MKKYGKIIIAFMWLGLTMIMIVGATFAWFAENRNVAADGMSVNAETVKNLLIKNNDSSNTVYSTSAASTLTNVLSLAPASTADVIVSSADSFFAAVDETRTNGYIVASSGAISNPPVTMTNDPFRAAHIASTNAEAAAFLEANSESHVEVAKHEFLVKTDALTLGELYLSDLVVTRAAQAADQSGISLALRVAVVCGDNIYIFAPLANQASLPEYKAIVAAAGTPSENDVDLSALPTNGGIANNTPTYELAESVTASDTHVFVYIWYEGQDANCFSANTAKVEDLTITVKFAALEASN